MDFKNVDGIEKSLCTGCGTCAGICPENAITMMLDREDGIYLPKVDSNRCVLCHLCSDSCPGISVDFNNLNECFFGKTPDNLFLGNFLKCFVGHATDYNIRYNSASGGLVTALLLFGLRKKLFDGALVTKMYSKNPLLPEPFLAKDSNSILEAATSKYCPVTVNTALKEILKDTGKFAVVGLPCHIEGTRKAQALIPKLRQRVPLLLGLFCGRSHTFHMTETLLSRLNIAPEDVISLRYRGKGWPGKIEITLRSGEQKILDYLTYYGALGGGWFHPLRCVTCPDATSELADLSFGDAWKIGKGDRVGLSLLIVRTQAGLEFINEAVAASVVKLFEVSPQAVIRSAKEIVNSKKKQLIPCLMIGKLFNIETPHFLIKLPLLLPKNAMGYAMAFLSYMQVILPQRYKRVITRYAPLGLLRVYHMMRAAVLWGL